MKCDCDNRLVWISLSVLAVTLFVHAGLPALTDLAGTLPPPTPEEQAEIDAAVDLSFQWFKEWWWVSTVGLVFILFWKPIFVLAYVCVDRAVSGISWLFGLQRWSAAVWFAVTAAATVWNFAVHGPVSAVFHLGLAAIVTMAIAKALGRLLPEAKGVEAKGP